MKRISKFTIAILLLNSSLTIMVGSVIAPALPSIVKQLNFNLSPGLLVTLPSLGVVIFSPIIGKLVNKLGPFKLIIYGLIPYALLGFVGIFLTNNWLLITDRILLGAACVAIQVSVTTFIAELFEGRERMKLIAWQGMAIELGGVLFLSLGGFLGEMGWQYPFYIYLIALVFFVFTWFSLPKSVHSKEEPVTDDHPKLNKNIYSIMLGSLFSMMIFFVCFVSLPQYLPEAFGFSESHTGYFMSLISLIAVLVASQLTRITDYIKPNNVVVLGFLGFSLGYLIYAIAPMSWLMYVGAIFTGIGFGLTVPLLNHMVVEVSTSKNRGYNLGIYSMMIFAGQFLATFIEFLPINSNEAFFITSILGVVVMLVLFFLFKIFK